MLSERGQASVEWTGLLLLVTLVLGAVVALAPRVEGHGLGAAVAERIACAAGGSCAGTAPAVRPAVAAGVRPAATPVPRARSRSGPSLAGARRVAGAVARRAWVACLGYRRYRYERSHPGRLSPFDPIPFGEALSMANTCLNPFGFLGDG